MKETLNVYFKLTSKICKAIVLLFVTNGLVPNEILKDGKLATDFN